MTYQLFIAIYAFLARIYALFNKKAALLVKGQGKTYDILRGKVVPGKKYLWFHAASLGEFEQGRPLME
ncbi:MAG: 3-deoxy-D-manno-octulosonic acid transferase, partial [Bacteroidaceae bacterium]|nr:3-deoxy-D-manno-octulosonic acid transferase [Bacteroidaceae bacterium]